VARSYIDYERKLDDHCNGGWESKPGFARFVAEIKKMEAIEADGGLELIENEQGQMVNPSAICRAQADRFFVEAKKVLVKHSARWLRELLYTALGDDAEFAVPLGRVLLAGVEALESLESPEGFATAIAEAIAEVPEGQRIEIPAQEYDRDSRKMRDYNHYYNLRELLSAVTAPLDVETCKHWPLMAGREVKVPPRTRAEDGWTWQAAPLALALQAWVDADGDSERLTREHADVVSAFQLAWCWGYPSSTQATERGIKIVAEFVRGKPTLNEKTVRQLHLVRVNFRGQERYEIALAQRALADAKSNAPLSERAEQTKRSRLVCRATTATLSQYAKCVLTRIPETEAVVGAAAVAATPHDARIEEKAATILDTAIAVRAKERGFATRRAYTECNVLLVPKLPASFLNKVKRGHLRSFRLVEAELRARGIGGWTPHPKHKQTLSELREKLQWSDSTPGAKDGFLVGGLQGDCVNFSNTDTEAHVAADDAEGHVGEAASFFRSLADWFMVDCENTE
jgi:hypothetical protein